ncbi:non-canonical purine NTP pyrophosphatase [Patescibacteria group bacterium]|nr:non-canonical purine NTP pyrophosphatase [Patescibacteria group bacterium]MBU1613208.1 non-canonical purine NTP pyrophosphatase [Patescibacteria group bacterium]
MQERKVLIATTNAGKFDEFLTQLGTLNCKFVSLNDVDIGDDEPDEPFETTWQNAMHKARYYGLKTGLVTFAEDTAFCVEYLNGAPGVLAKRFGATPLERNHKILKALNGASESARKAYFQTAGCVFFPENNNFYIFNGRVDGLISESISKASRPGMGYDSIFYFPPLKSCFAELTIEQKNSVSHRGQIIKQLKNFLQRMYLYA